MVLLDVAPAYRAEPPAFVSVEAARLRAIDGVCAVDGDELVPLSHARGRIAAVPVHAPKPVPPFHQSAMDGYAVRTSDLASGAMVLPVVARQAAGPDRFPSTLQSPGAVRIFTGAAIPAGCDAVVMQEECSEADGRVSIRHSPQPGEHIRPAGDDILIGGTLVEAGTLIDARHIAILAAAGLPEVRVRRHVRVAVLSTGTELREPHEQLAPGEIHDSNRAMLMSMLQAKAFEVTDLGGIEDNAVSIGKALEIAAAKNDVIISSGGVSVGEEDHIRAAVLSIGGSFVRLKASIKPGKPASVGRIGAVSLIALPGNPVSALVTYLWFGRPVLQRRIGLEPQAPRAIAAVAAFNEFRRPGRDEFVPVLITGWDGDGRPQVEKHRTPGSARLSSLIDADGLAGIPGELPAVRRGDPLKLYPFGADFSL